MRVLFDTNILIYREDHRVIPSDIQKLQRILSALKTQVLVHPGSTDDVNRDADRNRYEVIASKIKSYPMLENPPDYRNDSDFLLATGQPRRANDTVDLAMLYAVSRNAVDYLITEDKGIHTKAQRLGVEAKVISIIDAIRSFEQLLPKEVVSTPPALRTEFVYNLFIGDPIFASLKSEYPEFETWFEKIQKEGRKCWVYYMKDGGIGAILIYKVEDGLIENAIPNHTRKKRLKICTMKVEYTGYKFGELFIKLSIEYALKNGLAEVYLTHFSKSDDDLVSLLLSYGFQKVAKNARGEDIFLKAVMSIPDQDKRLLSPLEISRRYWPSFFDGPSVSKFVVPIQPYFHDRLFVERKIQVSLFEAAGDDIVIEGNTIQKAYLCHRKVRNLRPGSVLLFYRSKDAHAITTLGVAEEIHTELSDMGRIADIVGKRTAYSQAEVEQISLKPTTVILFTWHFYLKRPLKIQELKRTNVLKSAPQSILQIDHKTYLRIRKEGEIDERFAIG